MSNARNLADLLDSTGDVKSDALDNVPAADVVNDTTPQLGGNLDLNSNNITGTGNIDITGTITADAFALLASDLPSGAILQVKSTNSYIPNEQTISPGSYYNFPSVTITPKSSNSTIYIFTTPTFYSRSTDGTASDTWIYLADSTNNIQVKMHEWVNYSDVQSHFGLRLRYPFIYPFSNTVTTAREFRCRAYANHSSKYGRIGGENMHSIVAIEVAN